MSRNRSALPLPAATLAVAGWLLAAAATASPLRIVHVGAPAVNCVFTASCTMFPSDHVGTFAVPAASGDGALQSRTYPAGDAGTRGAGLFPYEYRVDLTRAGGITAQVCVRRLEIEFGPVVPLDYDGSGRRAHVYVVTTGGLGTVAPSSADLTGRTVTFQFSPAVCPGNRPGAGETSFFFGMASANPPVDVTAKLGLTDGSEETTSARAPARSTTPPPPPPPTHVGCEVLPAVPGGPASVPIDPTTPLCRCLQDPALRFDTHCGFFLPGLELFWRIPIPLPPGDPFAIVHSGFPFSEAGSGARIELLAPQGFERIGRGSGGEVVAKQPLAGDWLLAPEKAGSYEGRFDVTLPAGPNGAGKAFSVTFPIDVGAPRP
jgi:hypothetical protein